ncbi:MAG: prepilin peptidase [Actinomycetota bacterium]
MLIYVFAFVLISATDLKFRIIPKGINLALVAATSTHLIVSGNVALLLASLLSFPIYALVYRLTKGAIGYGDVRLAPVAIDLHSNTPTSPLSIHLLAWVFAGFFVLLRNSPSTSLPFAPFLLSVTIIINHL